LALILLNIWLGLKVSDDIVLVQYFILLTTGWCSLSYRQKLLAVRITEVNTYSHRFYYYLASIVITMFIAVLVSAKISSSYQTASITPMYFGIFIFVFIILIHINSFGYAFYWAEKKLYRSYVIESFPTLSLIVGISFRHFFGWDILTSWGVTFFLLTMTNLLVYRFSVMFQKIRLDKAIFFAWFNSQLIAVISYFEIFLFSDIDGEGLSIFKYLMVASMVIVTITTVLRQMIISKGQYELSNYTIAFGTILSLASIGCLLISYQFDLLIYGLIFVSISILQNYISMGTFKLHLENKTHLVFSVTFLVFLYVVCLSIIGLEIVNPSTVLQAKISVISLSVILTSALLFYDKRHINKETS
jgi:hypothetical protein